MSRLLARARAALGHTPVPEPVAPGAVTMAAENVALAHGDRTVLSDVDLQVHAGELLVLVGPNGAGKSTLLAALAGDLAPTSGTILLGERPIDSYGPLEMSRRRAVLQQQNTVGFPFSSLEVVRMGRAPWLRTPREDDDEQIVADAMEQCDVTRFADRAFTSLSGGERARVALARVLAQDTETILLDEPTAALDLGHQETVMTIARDHARAGRAVVVVLHDLGLAAAYADRIVVLEDGRIAAAGPPAEILTAELLTRVYRHPIELVAHPATGALLVVPHRVGPQRVVPERTR